MRRSTCLNVPVVVACWRINDRLVEEGLDGGWKFPKKRRKRAHAEVRDERQDEGKWGTPATCPDPRFRSDLFYRLNVMPLTLPPLRERKEDILPLVEFFLHQSATDGGRIPEIEDEAVRLLKTYTWPGNVRELRNVIQRALALAPAGRITASHISQCLPDVAAPPAGQDPWTAYLDATLHAADQGTLTKAHAEVMKEAQRQLFRLALQRTHGNKTAASRLLGITRPYFTERASQLGIRP